MPNAYQSPDKEYLERTDFKIRNSVVCKQASRRGYRVRVYPSDTEIGQLTYKIIDLRSGKDLHIGLMNIGEVENTLVEQHQKDLNRP